MAKMGCYDGRRARCLVFRLLAKALGEKAGKDNNEANKIAWIRVIILAQAIATNLFIVAGVIKHW